MKRIYKLVRKCRKFHPGFHPWNTITQAWWDTPEISAPGRWKQEDMEFEVSLGHTRSCLQKRGKMKRRRRQCKWNVARLSTSVSMKRASQTAKGSVEMESPEPRELNLSHKGLQTPHLGAQPEKPQRDVDYHLVVAEIRLEFRKFISEIYIFNLYVIFQTLS